VTWLSGLGLTYDLDATRGGRYLVTPLLALIAVVHRTWPGSNGRSRDCHVGQDRQERQPRGRSRGETTTRACFTAHDGVAKRSAEPLSLLGDKAPT
jgi:hypothetical protein